MARSLRSQKKQTRITFQPLPSSSPAKTGYSSAVQDRLASVRLEGSRRIHPESHSTVQDKSDALLTPAPSSQIRVTDAGASSPLTKFLRSATSPQPLLQPSRAIDGYVTVDEDEEDVPLPSSKRRRLTSRADQSDIHESASPRRSSRFSNSTPRNTRPQRFQVPSSPDSSNDNNNVSTQDHKSSPRLSSIASAETSGDDDDVFATQKPRARTKPSRAATSNDPFVVDDDDIQYISSSEDTPKRRPDRTKDSRKLTRSTRSGTVEDRSHETTDEGDGDPQSSSRRGRKKSARAQREALRREQEELEEDLLDLQDSDQDDLAELSRTRGGPVTTERDKTREHFARLKRQRANERIPRIIDSSDEDHYENCSDIDQGVDIDNIGHELDSLEAESDQSSELPLIGAPDAEHLSDHADKEIIEIEEDDFIVEDNTASVGRHGRPHPDIPLQFTKFASAKPKELFIHIIEWMVKNKISPAFSRDDDVYTMSFSRIDDQVKAQAGSRLISSAWNATFKNVILARPNIKVVALPGLDEDNIRTCDACNRTNHPARYDFNFTGHSYYKDTLEPVDNDYEDEDEDDDDDDDNDKHHDEQGIREQTKSAESHTESDSNSRSNNATAQVQYDEHGHLLARESQHFYLGRFCAANAEMGHKLSHWKYHLNEKVLSYLEEQGVLSADAIVARDKLNKKKREKEAEAIVDTMAEIQVVEELWQAFQDDLEDAKFGMEDHVRSSGRGKGRIGSVRVQRSDGRIGEWNDGGKYKGVTVPSDSEGE